MSAATPLPTPDDLTESLEAALDDTFTGLPRDSEGRPYLPDDDAADWALRKLAKHRDHMAEVRRMARERIDAIKAWEERQLELAAGDAAFFEGMLEGYHRRVLDEQPVEWAKKERKTITLPHGELKARAGRPKVVFEDEEQLVQWLRDAHPESVEEEVVYKVSKADLRKAFREADGRLIDAADPECAHCKGTGWQHAGDEMLDPLAECPAGCAGATGEPVPGVRIDTDGPTYTVVT